MLGYRLCDGPDADTAYDYEAVDCTTDPACSSGPTSTPRPTNPPNTGTAPTVTPTPPIVGTVRARAVAVDLSDTSCTAITSNPNYLDGTVFTITGQSPKLQEDGAYVQWAGVRTGGYTLSASFPGDWGLVRGCWSRTVTNPTSGTGMGASLAASGEVLTWNVGAVGPGPWVQTMGGDVYAAGSIQSFIPTTAQPTNQFMLLGGSSIPGVLRYGADYDFQINEGEGGTKISATNWNVNVTDRYTVDYYDLFWRQFGGPTTSDYTPEQLALPISQPASRETPYFVQGDMTIGGNWFVPNGQSLIFLVAGNLTITGRVTTAPTGFVAFIVDGNITVDPSVGTTYSSTAPVLKGVYITSPHGTFETGDSSVVGAERFVAQGMFIAGAFELQRTLSGVGQDPNYAAEYFIYDPSILLTMPDVMMDAAVTWSEVAP